MNIVFLCFRPEKIHNIYTYMYMYNAYATRDIIARVYETYAHAPAYK